VLGRRKLGLTLSHQSVFLFRRIILQSGEIALCEDYLNFCDHKWAQAMTDGIYDPQLDGLC